MLVFDIIKMAPSCGSLSEALDERTALLLEIVAKMRIPDLIAKSHVPLAKWRSKTGIFPYPTDGLIFTPCVAQVGAIPIRASGTAVPWGTQLLGYSMPLYKWKPVSELTCDFKLSDARPISSDLFEFDLWVTGADATVQSWNEHLVGSHQLVGCCVSGCTGTIQIPISECVGLPWNVVEALWSGTEQAWRFVRARW